ncbi:phenylalanine--tRNA ligase subunit beta [Spiroplasma endosymbiont of Aspidapion aeneum]|uniref:phenylalanine--tRNA ligase subunit beta n=1 Tax=Spiroplasma endosymbiont of Aspidapion aeneum TaxID=3066276 RepID=UPI00313EF982
MKLNLNLLNKFVDLSNLQLKDIVNRLTDSGFEIESIEPFIDCDKLTIGEIVDVQKDKTYEKVNICNVNVGNKVIKILTTATNVYKGMRVLVALDGTELRSINKKIVKSKLYNHDSEGMLIGLSELGIPNSYLSEEEINSIYELDKKAPIGEDGVKYLGWGLSILDVSILPNRIDVYNYYNFAKEFSSLFNIKLRTEPFIKKIIPASIENDLQIKVTSKNCELFSLSKIQDIKISMSPLWLRAILWKNDINAVNNIVDYGNLIAIILNQPVNIYDYDKLNSTTFEIKEVSDTNINLLNNREYKLNNNLCVINKGIVAIAGIMGTVDSTVDTNTKNIVLEVANFSFKKIREEQKKLGFSTDSSLRYSRGVNSLEYEFTHQLFFNFLSNEQKNAKYSYIVTKKSNKLETKLTPINVDFEYLKEYSSIDKLTINEVEKILKALWFNVEKNNNVLKIISPVFRKDILTKQDIVEEIVRYVGYERVKSIAPLISINNDKPFNYFYKFLRHLRSYLVNHGFFETINYSLTTEHKAKEFNILYKPQKYWQLANEISTNRSTMRSSLTPGLLETVIYNNNKQVKNVNIFEISKVYFDNREEIVLGIASDGLIHHSELYKANNYNFYALKGIVDGIFNLSKFDSDMIEYKNIEENSDLHFGKSALIYYNNDLIGYLGELHPLKKDIYKIKNQTYVCELDLKKIYELYRSGQTISKDISIFPKVTRDISFTIKDNLNIKNIIKYIKSLAISNLQNIYIFDVYKKDENENEKSVALRFEFQDANRTLNDEEVNIKYEKIKKEIITKYNVIIRE